MQYFLLKGEKDCRKEIWEFVGKSVTCFNNNEEVDECKHKGISEAYLFFVHNVMSEFHTAILTLESDSCTILEIDQVMNKLILHLKSRMEGKFYGSKNKTVLKTVSPPEEKEIFCAEADDFLKRAIQYLADRYDFTENCLYKKLSALSLKNESLFSWDILSQLPELLNIPNEIDQDALYMDYCQIKTIYKQLDKDMSSDKIWAQVFKKCDTSKNLKRLLSFVMSIPVSNAYCKRVFSLLNQLYTKERNRMGVDLIKAEIMIRLNFETTCTNFKSFLGTPQGLKLVDSVKSNTK